jgi:DNA repair exonuclease SbcCD ATPase subunit
MSKVENGARKLDRQQDTVHAAREDLARTEAAHAREAQRLEEARREIERLGDELRAVDPDEPRFARLAGEREAARAKAGALGEREEAARATFEQARDAVAAREREQAKAKIGQLDADLRALDAAITEEVRAAYRRLLDRIGAARKIAAEANALETTLGLRRTDDGTRGSRWAAASPTKSAWRWAQGVLPEDRS